MKVFLKVVGNIDKVILFEDTAAVCKYKIPSRSAFSWSREKHLYWNFFYLLSFAVFSICHQLPEENQTDYIFILFDMGDLCPEFVSVFK